MKTPIYYNNTFQSFTENQQSIELDCAEVTFINYGETLVILNGSLPILPNGGSISFDGKQYEEDTTRYYFTFDNSNPALLNGVCVIRKTYSDYPITTEQ